MKFEVITAETVYWAYEVEAETADEARAIGASSEGRAALEEGRDAGSAGDIEVIEVRPAKQMNALVGKEKRDA